MTHDGRIRRRRFRDGVFSALTQASKEPVRGQPLMVDRFRAVAEMAEELAARGIPFATCRNSRMNKEIRKRLNEDVRKRLNEGHAVSIGKSGRRQIKAGAVESCLKKVAALRSISDHFVEMGLYGD